MFDSTLGSDAGSLAGGPDARLNQRERQKIGHVKALVSELLQTFRSEERRLLCLDRYNKYPSDVRVRKDLVECVLGQLEEPLDKGTIAQLLKALGPLGGPPLGMVTLEWMLEAGWEGACSLHAFNALLALCDRCCHDKKTAFEVLDVMKRYQVKPDLFSYNLLIGVCRIHGDYSKAFDLFEELNISGVIPNMFTFTTLIEACNYRKGGHCHEALYAFRSLLNAGEPIPDYVKEELVSCIENGCAKTDLKGALEIFAKLEAVGMAQSTRAYNAVLKACGRSGEWVAALDIYACLKHASCEADTESYNAIINACCVAGEAEKALEVFEWMNEGRAASAPVPANTRTYNLLINVCNQKGMLEKALEVYTWMQGSGVVADGATYDGLIQTVDDAREWDDSISLGTAVSGLRPAPFDGMRMLYMEQHVEKSLDERLAEIKLGETSWAPCHMRTPAGLSASGPLPTYSLYDFLGEERGVQTACDFGRTASPSSVASQATLRGFRNTGPLSPLSPNRHAKPELGGSMRIPVTRSSSVSRQSSTATLGASNYWSASGAHSRRPPPLSAKEIVLAREHGVDPTAFRLAS